MPVPISQMWTVSSYVLRPVSYTHLDVYKRQVLDREQRKVRATVVPKVNREALQTAVLNQVAPGSKIYTDEAAVYKSLPKEYTHEFVNHVEKYVHGRVHTNGMENFWSLLKRCV